MQEYGIIRFIRYQILPFFPLVNLSVAFVLASELAFKNYGLENVRIKAGPLLDLHPDSPIQSIQSITALVRSNFSRVTRPPGADLLETLYPLVNRCKYCGVRQTLSGKHGTSLRASVIWTSSCVKVSESALSHVALPEATPFWRPKASPVLLGFSLSLSLSVGLP